MAESCYSLAKIAPDFELRGRIIKYFSFCGGLKGIRNYVRFLIRQPGMVPRRKEVMFCTDDTEFFDMEPQKSMYRKIAEEKYLREGVQALPAKSFADYFESISKLDPINLFGEIDEETRRLFYRDLAQEVDAARLRGEEEATVQSRETIELDSDSEPDDDVCFQLPSVISLTQVCRVFCTYRLYREILCLGRYMLQRIRETQKMSWLPAQLSLRVEIIGRSRVKGFRIPLKGLERRESGS